MSEFWFPCYANDLLGSFRWKCMTPAQRGAYWQLICWQMQAEDGKLPGDVGMMGALADLPLVGADACILDAFPLGDDGKRANPRAYREWEKRVGLIAVRSECGAKGAAKRWSKDGKSDSKSHDLANGNLMHNQSHNQNQNQDSPPSPPLGGVGVLESVSPPSLFPGGESLSPEKEAPKKKKAVAVEKPDPWCWPQFAAVYPGFRLKPDKAAKDWLRRNVPNSPAGCAVLDRILVNIRGWLKSEQWIQGKVPNCSKYLDERIWEGEPGPPPRGTVQERQDGNREAMAGAAKILGFDKEV